MIDVSFRVIDGQYAGYYVSDELARTSILDQSGRPLVLLRIKEENRDSTATKWRLMQVPGVINNFVLETSNKVLGFGHSGPQPFRLLPGPAPSDPSIHMQWLLQSIGAGWVVAFGEVPTSFPPRNPAWRVAECPEGVFVALTEPPFADPGSTQVNQFDIVPADVDWYANGLSAYDSRKGLSLPCENMNDTR